MSFATDIVKKILGISGMTFSDLENETYRNKFSDYLPWIAYSDDTKSFLCADNTAGFMFECSPLAFASEKTVETLEGLLRLNVPDGSVLQFILFADNNITPYVDIYKSLKKRDIPLVQEGARRFGQFLIDGSEGLSNTGNIPVRDFRLFVTIKFPIKEWGSRSLDVGETHRTVSEILKGANLFPREMDAEDLIRWMSFLFNEGYTGVDVPYNDSVPLNRQVILAETPITKSMSSITIGTRNFRCTTPKRVPREIDITQTNVMFGGIKGIQDDINQYRTPFIYCINVVFSNLSTRLHTKCNAILQQKGVGSFAFMHAARQEEHQWAVDELEKGRRFLEIVPILWVYGNNEKLVSESIIRARRLWEDCGFVMQEDRGILPILFISSLPFGFYNTGRNLMNLERHFVVPTDTIATLLPIQADFAGGGKPQVLFVGRKGQLISLDIFHKAAANNHNMFITAASGAGKSFTNNYFLYNYYANGAKVRVIDIGDSYKKMTKIASGRYLDIEEDDMCINPFSSIVDEEYDLNTIPYICAQMVYSNSDRAEPTQTEMELLTRAVIWAYRQEGTAADIEHVYQYLAKYPMYAGNDEEEHNNTLFREELATTAHRLSFNMRQFARGGQYEKYFNGASTFNIRNDEFVTLELGKISSKKELFNVVTLQVINAVTSDLYFSARNENKLIVFDEAWQFIRDSAIIGKVIEEGYRKARKYNGSFTIITQSINDLELFGRVGKVIYANSAFKLYLQAQDIEKAREAKFIDYSDFELALLKSVRKNTPKYSEIFIDSPYGKGVARLAVDPFSYWIYTSDPDENTLIERTMEEEGCTFEGAIKEIVSRTGVAK